jgi:DsbC/DsbD-like thiol-disulfide interchange protein
MIASAVFSRPAAHVPLGLAIGAFLCIQFASLGCAGVASQPPWVASTNSKVRLVSGTVTLDGKPSLMADVQLRMEQGWKTYWKSPGDSGVPPSFDWSGSKNLKAAEVLYPAPHRFADANGTAIGYDDEVTFPVKVTPEREGEPVELKLVFDYGLCKDLCIPNDVTLALTLPAEMDGRGDALLLESFLARVPKPAAPDSLPRVESVKATLDGAKPEIVVDALFAPKASETDLFIEAGDMFVPVPKPLGPVDDGKQRFVVDFASPSEAEALKGKTLTLTLVSDLASTETTWKAE